MRKIHFFLSAVVLCMSCSCMKVTMEQQIDNIFTFVEQDSDLQGLFDKAPTISENEIIEYYSYILTDKLKIKDIWTQDFTVEDTVSGPKECQNLVAEIPGKNKKNQSIIISAPLNDPVACISAIEIMKTMKKAKVRKSNAIRLLLFDGDEGCHTYRDISRTRNEAILFNVELEKMDKTFQNFSIFERNDIFESVRDIVPQYLNSYAPCSILYDESDISHAINPHYQFVTSESSATSFNSLKTNISLSASLICILN